MILAIDGNKADIRPPRAFNNHLEAARSTYKELLKAFKLLNFVIVYVDECTFDSSKLPAHTWIKSGMKVWPV
jgi:hypothetical protein